MLDSGFLASLDVSALNKHRDALEPLPGHVRIALVQEQRVFLTETQAGEDGYVVIPHSPGLTPEQRWDLAVQAASERDRGEHVFGLLMHQSVVSHAFLPPLH